MDLMNIKVDLSKLNGIVRDIEGKHGKTKCAVLPIEMNEIFISEKGGIYLNLTATKLREEGRFGQTHFLKRRLSRDAYMSLSKEERERLPIVGDISPIRTSSNNDNRQNTQPRVEQGATRNGVASSDIDDLPF